jgi:general secretion pathway protein L
MHRFVLGLDICETSISAALIKSGLKNSRLVYGRRLPVSLKNGDAYRELTEALMALAKSMPVAPDAVSASLPSAWVSFRNLDAPFKNSRKIRKILPYELEPMLAMPIGEAAVDFIAAPGEGKSQITAAAIERSVLETFFTVLSDTGFEPFSTTPSGYATAVSLANRSDTPDQAMLLHSDAFTATIYLISSGVVSSIRAFKTPNSGPSKFEGIAKNIGRTIAAFEEQLASEFSPDCVFVSGTEDHLSRLSQFLEKDLGIPVRIAGPELFDNKKVALPSNLEHPRIGNALSLALLENKQSKFLNFRKGEFAATGKWTETRRSITSTVLLSIFSLILFVSSMFHQNQLLENRLEKLNREIVGIFKSTFPDVSRIVDPYHQMKVKLEEMEKRNGVIGYEKRSVRAIDLLNEISRRIPAEFDVEVSRMVLGPDNVQFSGTADTFKTVNDLQTKLEPSSFFSKVTISSANQERSGNRIQFNIKADF